VICQGPGLRTSPLAAAGPSRKNANRV
jgi:hypothetical protein